MNTEFRGITVDVRQPGKIEYGADFRAHTLIKNREDHRAFVDVVPYSFGPYLVPWGYEFLAWVLVPGDKEIERNYDLEEQSIGSVMTRFKVAITEAEFKQLQNVIKLPQAIGTTESA